MNAKRLDSIRYVVAILVMVVMATSHARASEVDFARDVLPLLTTHCLDCHGPDTQESDLRLDSMTHALTGGNSGEPAIVPGDSDASFLLRLVTSDDDATRMPPDSDPLSDSQLDTIRNWINEEKAWRAAKAEIEQSRPERWSFQPPTRPPLPDSQHDHPIDRFLSTRLAEAGLSMSKTATRSRLIRRLFLVMHGLPPTPKQVETFVNDDKPDAWNRLVDEVLASPRYGERLATHWLDLVRFGETHGFETNRERPNAWRYRDWVIDSFCSDKPYNDFVYQQIAGDAVGEDVGTGFLVAGPYDLVKGQDPKLGLMQRQDELADMINTTGTAFLGLTIGCARCHNHKFDPISQTDYYSLQAIFAGVNHAERQLPPSAAEREELAGVRSEQESLQGRLEKYRSRRQLREPVQAQGNVERFDPVLIRSVRMSFYATNSSQPCIDELEIFAEQKNVALASSGAVATSSGDFEHPLHKLAHINDGQYGNARSWISKTRTGGWVQITLPQNTMISRIEWARDRQGKYADRLATDYVIEATVDGSNWFEVAGSSDRRPYGENAPHPNYDFDRFPAAEASVGREMHQRWLDLQKKRERLETGPRAYAGTFSQPGPTHRLYRGEPDAKREEVTPGAIASLQNLGLQKNAPEQQRRITLAKWIASAENPLTARVFVNRIWQFHFGTGIVDTPSDFGGNGTLPSHPPLLDWLAIEFVEGGWSIKDLHRLILTSQAWRQDSRPSSRAIAVDSASRLLWRFPPRRLEAEAIRDSMLAVTGKLENEVGGPGFSAFEVEMENVRHYHPKKDFGPEDWRRMIYMTKVRQERDAVFGIFDCPDGNQVTPKRSRSTTPLQALNLLNSSFVMQQSAFLADRLRSGDRSAAQSIAYAYQLCFGRPPDAEETALAESFVKANGWLPFCRAMLNANEFLFIP